MDAQPMTTVKSMCGTVIGELCGKNITLGQIVLSASGAAFVGFVGIYIYRKRRNAPRPINPPNASRLELVEEVLHLRPGDHIYVDSGHDFRQAMVVEGVCDQDHNCSVIYFSAKCKRPVFKQDVNLTTDVKQRKLYRYHYEQLECYSSEIIALRARSFVSDQGDRDGVLAMFGKFFRNEDHFCQWCSIGFDLRDLVHVSGEVPSSPLRRIGNVMSGDHIHCRNSTGIVVEVDEATSRITVVCLQPATQRQPQRKTFHIGRDDVYRYDYDMAVGLVRDEVVDRANACVDDAAADYRDGSELALWCKTKTPTNSNWNLQTLSQWAAARLEGHVRIKVTMVDKIEPGDHIASASTEDCSIRQQQHYIVVDVIENHLVVIYLDQSKKYWSINKHGITFAPGEFYKYFYDIRDGRSADDVIADAKNKLAGNEAYELPFRDSYHFAYWCKTGSLYLQHP